MIKAVIFDIDGVLVDSLEANFKFLSDLMEKFGFGFMKPDEYTPLFHLPMKEIVRHVTKSNNEEEIEKIWLAGKERVVPYPNELVRAPKNLEYILETLSKSYMLAIVTSRSRSAIYSLPQLQQVRQYFKTDVSYEDTKEHKPDPAPLVLAAQKLNLNPSECVYIGDSRTDAIAAKAAGMKSIIYSKTKSDIADVSTSSFDELVEIVESL